MFILYAIVVGLVAGVALGGRVTALGDIRFRWAPLVVAGFLAQVVLFSDAVASRIGDAGPLLYVATTVIVGAAVVRNLRLPGMPMIVAGAAANLAAILANGGFMPTTADALQAAGRTTGAAYSNSAVLAHPALEPLIDRFALPPWLPFANVFSVGDVLIGVGVALLIVATMRGGRRSAPAMPAVPAAGAPLH